MKHSRSQEAENLSSKNTAKTFPFRVSFSWKKPMFQPWKDCDVEDHSHQTHFSLQIHPKRKTNPKRTNERTHRTAIIVITAMSAPDAKKTKPTGDPAKMLPQPFLKRSQLGHSWWCFWENPGEKDAFWNIGIPTLANFSMIFFGKVLISSCPGFFCKNTPLKTNMSVGRCIPHWNSHFFGDMLVFRGVVHEVWLDVI